MNIRNKLSFIILSITLSFTPTLRAQIPSNVYVSQEHLGNRALHYEVKIRGNYMIRNIYETTPNKFLESIGGYFTITNDTLRVKLEFNSNYAKDSISEVSYLYSFHNDTLKLHTKPQLKFFATKDLSQELDGLWLFAARSPDTGKKRRDDTNPRKTLKILQNNTFQWIAYNTQTMKFFGTGGGSFTSKNGAYIEKIGFFSRDSSRVGTVLDFNYKLIGQDWHHTGKNSKGVPMYEIWTRRD